MSKNKELNSALAALSWMVETEGRVWAIRPEMLTMLRAQREHAPALDAASQLLAERFDLVELAAEHALPPLTTIVRAVKAEAPPNLRDSDGDPDGDGVDDQCSNCENYDEGSCMLYNYQVDAGQVCDSYEVDEDLEEGEGASAKLAAARGRGRPPAINGAVATIPLKGVLMPQVSLLAMIFGLGGGLSTFRSQLKQAAEDDSIGAIVLDIDSPGGLVDQIPETAAEVKAARSQKPVIAVANTLAASAAYWLGSQAEEFVVTPSGEVGSIGVYAEHMDVSKALDRQGVTNTLVSAGKYKTEGNPYEPLSDDGRQAMQASVNDYYSMFTKDVASGRGATVAEVKDGYGEGRVLTAKRAVDAGLADRVATLSDVVSGLLKRSRQGSASIGRGLHGANATYSVEERVRVFDLLEAGMLTARKEVV